jgi:3-hydroxyisobutyrate dehydrogenase
MNDGETFAVVGLGNMGLPIAQRLSERGHGVIGIDPLPERRRAFQPSCALLSSALANSRVILLSLPSSREVEVVMRGPEGILEKASPGCLVIDTSTADPASSCALQTEAAAKGIGFVDAPVSGGASGAARGELLVMLGGEARDAERAKSLLAPLARKVVRAGGPGSGNVVKLANNLLCAANLALAGETLRLAKAAGVAPEALLEAVNAGSGRSAVSEVNLPRWVLSGAYNSGFTMGLMRKDVALAEAVAVSLGAGGGVWQAVAEAWAASAEALPDGEDFNHIVGLVPESKAS